jgi:hypothetical protein
LCVLSPLAVRPLGCCVRPRGDLSKGLTALAERVQLIFYPRARELSGLCISRGREVSWVWRCPQESKPPHTQNYTPSGLAPRAAAMSSQRRDSTSSRGTGGLDVQIPDFEDGATEGMVLKYGDEVGCAVGCVGGPHVSRVVAMCMGVGRARRSPTFQTWTDRHSWVALGLWR